MASPPTAQRPKGSRSGFSLVLSLVIMGMAVMSIIVIAGFLSVESHLAVQHQLALRARLNGVVSLRLALGHLQQEAGPDRRATARADLTQPDATPSTVRNPMWTGVWRTDKPNQPPSWLVSGNDPGNPAVQSNSLAGADTFSTGGAYPAGYWLPWETDYAANANDLGFISLVGAASAKPAESNGSADPIGEKPSGLVVLPKITLLEADPDGSSRELGSFAYWIGDEGVKARINLTDPRLDLPADDNLARSALRSASAPALSLLKGAENLTDESQGRLLGRPGDLRLLDGFNPSPDLNGRLFHDVTAVSAGVLADSANGGLRRDLSLAFELSDAEFTKTEFGSGTSLPATGTDQGLANVKMTSPINGKELKVTPVFNRVTPDGNLRGPTWWALRDYYRLYKQVGWENGVPILNARSFFPNAANLHPGPDNSSAHSIRHRQYLYSAIYSGDRLGLDPNVKDIGTIDESTRKWRAPSVALPRPFNCAVAPVLERVFLVFSLVQRDAKKDEEVRLNMMPIVVLHNPYNVALTGRPQDGDSALVLSFSEWAGWNFRVTRHDDKKGKKPKKDPDKVHEKDLSEYFRHIDPGAKDDSDMFRTYIDSYTLQPGEYKVFTPTIGPKRSWSRAVKLTNALNFEGGFTADEAHWKNIWKDFKWDPDDENFTFEIIPSGNFSVRYALKCWPGDRIFPVDKKDMKDFDLFNRSSEQAELIYRDIDPKVGLPDPLDLFDIIAETPDEEPSPGKFQPGIIISAFELSVKTAKESAASTTGVSPQLAGGFPLYTHSNPLGAVLHSDGAGRESSQKDSGFDGASPSYRMRVTRPSGGINAWQSLLQSDGAAQPLTYGGLSYEADGALRSVHTEVPLVPPTSLGQFAHANFHLRDQQPLYGVGNSFAHPQVAPTKTFTTAQNWTEYDSPYLLNAALWDSYFLSGAAPKMTRSQAPAAPDPADPESTDTTSPAYAETKKLPAVLDAFIGGDGKLENPRMRLTGVYPWTREALGDYRRSASVLLNDGAFNVNSTSVEAWTVFLGAAKKVAVAKLAANAPGPDANARFPRATPTGAEVVATGAFSESTKSNWAGFVNLTDAQLRLLAAAIVRENKARFQVTTRTERDTVNPPSSRLFRGLTKAATPYLSLSEFINRFLSPGSANEWATRCGALQAAIFGADNPPATGALPSAGLTNRLTKNYTVGMFGAANLVPPKGLTFPFPKNIEAMEAGGANRTHVAMGSPGNLLQIDLLQSLGASLATRSDTFTIRAYGEAFGLDGSPASCLLEAVVQRVPDYVNDRDPAEKAPQDLRIENKLFGRRFKVISLRWLNPHEA